MGMQKDARVTVGVDGAQEVGRAAGQALAPWERVSKTVGGAFGKVRGAVGEAVQGIVSDLGHVVTVAGAISFSGSVERVRAFEDSTARMGVASKRSIESVRAGFEQLAADTATKPEEVAAWTSQVGRLTYSYEGASQALRGMQEEALASGRSLQELGPLAATLHNVGKVSGDVGHALGVINAQAEALHTVGGPSALKDQIVGLAEVSSHFAIQSEKDFAKVTALAAGLGSGLSPAAAGRVQQQALSSLTSDPLGWERYLGHRITDEHGQVTDPTKALREIVEKTKRHYGKDARRVLQLNFGAETGAAMYGADWGAIGRAGAVEAAAPSGALDRFKQTDAGKRAVDEAKKAAAMRGVVGSQSLLGQASDAFGHFAADHPIAAAVSGQVGTRLLGSGVKGLMGMFSGGASTATGAGEAALGAGAGMTTLAGGTLLAGILGTGKTLMELGEASRAKQGFINKALSREEATGLATRAKAAEDEAASQRSPGMQAAIEAERAMQERERTKRQSQAAFAPAAAAPAHDAQLKAMIDQLMKQGASRELAQETAKALAGELRSSPMTFTVINATGGPVDVVQGEKSSGAGAQ